MALGPWFGEDPDALTSPPTSPNQAFKLKGFVFRVGHLLAPPHELERVVEELGKNLFDSRDALRDLDEVSAQCLGIPSDLAAALKAEARQGRLLKRYAGKVPPAPIVEAKVVDVGSSCPASPMVASRPLSPCPRGSTPTTTASGASSASAEGLSARWFSGPSSSGSARGVVRRVGRMLTSVPQHLDQIADTLEAAGYDSRESLKDLSDIDAIQLGVPQRLAVALRREACDPRLAKRYSGPVPPVKDATAASAASVIPSSPSSASVSREPSCIALEDNWGPGLGRLVKCRSADELARSTPQESSRSRPLAVDICWASGIVKDELQAKTFTHELAECTFRPTINRQSSVRSALSSSPTTSGLRDPPKAGSSQRPAGSLKQRAAAPQGQSAAAPPQVRSDSGPQQAGPRATDRSSPSRTSLRLVQQKPAATQTETRQNQVATPLVDGRRLSLTTLPGSPQQLPRSTSPSAGLSASAPASAAFSARSSTATAATPPPATQTSARYAHVRVATSPLELRPDSVASSAASAAPMAPAASNGSLPARIISGPPTLQTTMPMHASHLGRWQSASFAFAAPAVPLVALRS
eukprot:TRINITY_DN45014_c0_g5_i1.p1 TRINITY_DN45014_c0_g5~~TRINITY_DN45014_c0_g5_i1.p1  ORF type:complete len:594 (-),score=85.65 TRINITY_DN45014_c0_g5_i1:371-2113(-)